MKNLKQAISDIFDVVKPTSGALIVWRRNFLYFRYTLWISILWVLIEPLLFLGAIGYGLGSMVQEVEGRSFLQFFYPGLMVASGMMVAFFEATYGSYTKLTRQKTFETMLLAPLGSQDIVLGEITWAASKGFLSSSAVLLVSLSIGLASPQSILLLSLLNFLNAFVFASFAFLMTSYARNYDWFIYAQTGVIMPMYLFSGTYFPLSNVPDKVVWIAEFFPLTHSVRMARGIAYSEYHSSMWIGLVVLILFGFIFMNWSSARIRRRLTY